MGERKGIGWDRPAGETVDNAGTHMTLREWVRHRKEGGVSWSELGRMIGCSDNSVRVAARAKGGAVAGPRLDGGTETEASPPGPLSLREEGETAVGTEGDGGTEVADPETIAAVGETAAAEIAWDRPAGETVFGAGAVVTLRDWVLRQLRVGVDVVDLAQMVGCLDDEMQTMIDVARVDAARETTEDGDELLPVSELERMEAERVRRTEEGRDKWAAARQANGADATSRVPTGDQGGEDDVQLRGPGRITLSVKGDEILIAYIETTGQQAKLAWFAAGWTAREQSAPAGVV